MLNEEELKRNRKTKWLGNQIYYYDVTDSTNTQARRLAEEGSPNGTCVLAGYQESGKGRRGRTWNVEKNGGIFMTLLLRPKMKPNEAPQLTLVTALAVAKAIEKTVGVPAKIKWPNDIVIGGKKVCGILTEMSTETEAVNYVIIGIGINVAENCFPAEFSDKATSLCAEAGKTISRAPLIEAVWEEFEEYFAIFEKTYTLAAIQTEYNRYLVNNGRQVRILDPKEPFEGTAAGITETGELIVDTKQGRRLVSSGEVSVRGIYGYV